jgi:uncharacterized protein (DUF1697 family)
MNTYLALLRGINVGGKNKVPMATLKKILEALGFSDVSTYIASGNVILKSDKSAEAVRTQFKAALTENFKLDDELIKVLVLTPAYLASVIRNKPKGFGDEPDKYHSDVIFLIDVEVAQVMPVFNPREGVDQVWAGDGVVYSQRLSAERTKSRLNKIMSVPAYKSMTIRNWNTTTKLLELINHKENMS